MPSPGRVKGKGKRGPNVTVGKRGEGPPPWKGLRPKSMVANAKLSPKVGKPICVAATAKSKAEAEHWHGSLLGGAKAEAKGLLPKSMAATAKPIWAEAEAEHWHGSFPAPPAAPCPPPPGPPPPGPPPGPPPPVTAAAATALVSALVVVAGPPPRPPSTAGKGDGAKRPKPSYRSRCDVCHGELTFGVAGGWFHARKFRDRCRKHYEELPDRQKEKAFSGEGRRSFHQVTRSSDLGNEKQKYLVPPTTRPLQDESPPAATPPSEKWVNGVLVEVDGVRVAQPPRSTRETFLNLRAGKLRRMRM